jgi:hypothetical protein
MRYVSMSCQYQTCVRLGSQSRLQFEVSVVHSCQLVYTLLGFCCLFSFFTLGFGCDIYFVWIELFWLLDTDEMSFCSCLIWWTCGRRKYMSFFWILQKLGLLLWDLKEVIHWWVFIWDCLVLDIIGERI